MGGAVGEFLKALPTVAGSPLAFVGYLVVIVAWAATSVLSSRTNRLFQSIDKLPEKDRIEAINLEYKTVPRTGVTAGEWLQAKQATYKLVRLGAMVLVVLAILGLSAYFAHDAMQTQKAAASTEELKNILNRRAQRISDGLKAQGDPQSQEAEKNFVRLHGDNIKALDSGDEVESHEIQRDIGRVLSRTPYHNDYAMQSEQPGFIVLLRQFYDYLFKRSSTDDTPKQ